MIGSDPEGQLVRDGVGIGEGRGGSIARQRSSSVV